MRLLLPLGLVLPLLAGCSLSPTTPSTSTAEKGAPLTGVVHGGQQQIAGQHIYLLAANTTGYGGNGILPTSSNASISLLNGTDVANNNGTKGVGWDEDANNNYYVITDANGNFNLTGDYTCTTGQQVYIYGVGGDTGSGANSAAGLMAVLGACPGTSFSSSLFVTMNEVSTIAAAYAFAGFATDATHVSSSGTALAKQGIANAFANAANLVTLGTGTALTTTPGGNGAVPQQTINTLANILAACINTSGTGSSGCNTLLTNATSNGISIGSAGAGTEPTDTATTAIYIAQNPGANISPLYGLPTGTPPFGSALSAQPNDFTLGINFTDGNLSSPSALAIDGAANVWVLNNNSVTELSSSGSILLSGDTNGNLNFPQNIAIDGTGHVWITNYNSSSITELSNSGLDISNGGYTNGLGNNPIGVAIDGVGNVWITNESGNNSPDATNGVITVLNSSGSDISNGGYAGSVYDPDAVAIDGSGNAWIVNRDGTVTELNSSGSDVSNGGYGTGLYPGYNLVMDGAGDSWIISFGLNKGFSELNNTGGVIINGYTNSGIEVISGIAMDGAGNAWFTNDVNGNSNLLEFSPAGVELSGINGYAGGISSGVAVAIDGSGDTWVTNQNGGVTELIGAAVPVITPVCAGLPSTPTNDGTSRLASRP